MTKNEKLKVLIIDDDQDLLGMYKTKFMGEGFQVFTQTDGLRGVTDAVKINPDIVLMDLMMPQMDGFESIQAFRQNTSLPVKIIVLSNLAQESDKEKAISCGADGFLVKANHTPLEIVEKVKEFLID